MSRARLISRVLLPFAAGHFMTYLFRSINAVVAVELAAEFHLSATELGLLTGAFLLTFGAAQLPLGMVIDRLEPGVVHSVLMLVASMGALTFALADNFAMLVVGRALIGLGVAASMMAGTKAITIWFPSGQLALATGSMVTLGALGALTSTGPAAMAIDEIGWRALFVMLAALSALAALIVLIAVPRPPMRRAATPSSATLSAVYRDPRFWRVAPTCALGVGTSWSLQGLWAAPWLRDVEGLNRIEVIQHLSAMAIAVCISASLLGMAVDRLRRLGIKTEVLLVGTFSASALAQLALIMRWPLPTLVPWIIIAAASAGTVLSYSLMSEYFPKAMSARANSAINVMHVGCAFALQLATGLMLSQWPSANGAYPPEAHQTGMAIPLALQIASLVWVAFSYIGRIGDVQFTLKMHAPTGRFSPPAGQHSRIFTHDAHWRAAAAASTVLCVTLTAALILAGERADHKIRLVEVVPWVEQSPESLIEFFLESPPPTGSAGSRAAVCSGC